MNNFPDVRAIEGPLEVGKFYMVPCGFINFWIPILDEHVGDISGDNHVHIDGRFLTDEDLERIDVKPRQIIAVATERILDRKTFALKCQFNYHKPDFHYPPSWPVLQESLKARKCKLDLNCMVCPHQGLSLKQVLPVTSRGKKSVVCPNHHIEWSLKDGSLVPRDTTQFPTNTESES